MNQAIKLNPRSIFYHNRGLLYKYQGKADLALADYNQALAINPNFAITYDNRGSLYADQGKADLALADYNQALALNPNDALTYARLGSLYQQMGNIKAARTNLQKAQQLFIAQSNTAWAQLVANLLSQLHQQNENEFQSK